MLVDYKEYASKEYVQDLFDGGVKTVNGVTPDIDGNIQLEIPEEFGGSWNDLAERPFGEETITTVVAEPINITWDGNTEGLYTFSIDSIETQNYYRVSDTTPTIDQLHAGTAIQSKPDGQVNATVSLSETRIYPGDYTLTVSHPRIIVVHDESYGHPTGLYFNVTSNGYYVSSLTTEAVEKIETELKTLDKKYLPEHLQFGEGMIAVSEPLDVTWDGNTDNVYTIVHSGDTYYRLSDAVVTSSIMKTSGSFNFYRNDTDNVTEYTCEDGRVTSLLEAGGEIFASQGLRFMFVPTETDDKLVGLYVREDPNGYVSSITTTEPVEQTKMGIKTIDPKYLPATSSGAGANVYVQDTEPTDAEEGALWVDTANEPAIMDQELPVVTAADNGKVLMVVNGQYQLVDLALSADANGVLSV